jgi:hypothetical protein
MDEVQPIPGLYSNPEELETSWKDAAARLPADVLLQWTADVAEATARGDEARVRQLSVSMLCTIRLNQNDDYRRAVKQVERSIEETVEHRPMDRRAHFAALRAAG